MCSVGLLNAWTAAAWCAGAALSLGVGAFTGQQTNNDRPVAVYPTLPTIGDKTLVVWLYITHLTQRGGSALTIERKGQFDAIVFGELRPGVWMVGSDGFRRTQQEQEGYPSENAGPDELIRMAAVYRGTEVTLWRNDEVYARYSIGEPAVFGPGSTVLIGLRHEAVRGRPNSYFAGIVEEARIYPKALSDEELQALRPGVESPARPLGWWTFDDGQARDLMGNFPNGVLYGGAYIQNGRLYLDGKEAFMMTPSGISYRSPVHFRPKEGVFADPIPFYWDGQYHIFYLQGDVGPVPWQHIVSRDLVHWQELPPALVTDGPPDGPNGLHMFTGSVVEKDGTFHIFYTGHNPNNPAGLEFVLHATSPDLVHWTKHPDEVIGPDGAIYSAAHDRNWRDPYVFWNEEEGQYWMVLIATDAKTGRPVQGLLVSRDLREWEYQPPLEGVEGQECPDLFKIGNTWYLIGGHMYYSAESPRGPYRQHENHIIDRPGLYAGKRMFDGRRHVWVAWAWDNREPTDTCPDGTWGGYMCLPRELYPGPEGQLYCRPAREISTFFGKTVLDLAQQPEAEIGGGTDAKGHYQGGRPVELGASGGASKQRFDAPPDYMLDCEVRLEPQAEFVITAREQPESGLGYQFVLRPAKREIAIITPASEWTRPACTVDTSHPVKIQIFVAGTLMECFVNDAYALSRRIYDFAEGKLGLSVRGGRAQVLSLQVKTCE